MKQLWDHTCPICDEARLDHDLPDMPEATWRGTCRFYIDGTGWLD